MISCHKKRNSRYLNRRCPCKKCSNSMLKCICYDFSKLKNIPKGPGVYGAWYKGDLIYVGMAENLSKRLKSHFNGCRSGDRFCLYICDIYLRKKVKNIPVPPSNKSEVSKEIDQETRSWIRENVCFCIIPYGNKTLSKKLEEKLRHDLKPLINPKRLLSKKLLFNILN